MSDQMIALQVPQKLYRRLQKLSDVTRRPLEKIVLQTLDANVPTLPEHLSEEVRKALSDLELLDDEALWKIARSKVGKKMQEEYRALLSKNREENLQGAEKETLEKHYQNINLLMLKKAYAFVLLKWRGYKLPSLEELESQA